MWLLTVLCVLIYSDFVTVYLEDENERTVDSEVVHMIPGGVVRDYWSCFRPADRRSHGVLSVVVWVQEKWYYFEPILVPPRHSAHILTRLGRGLFLKKFNRSTPEGFQPWLNISDGVYNEFNM